MNRINSRIIRIAHGITRELTWVPAVAFLGLFFFYPFIRILWEGLESLLGNGLLGVSFAQISRLLLFTIWQAFLSTMLTLAVGLPGAYLFARFTFPGKTILRILTSIPFVLPTIVVAAGLDAMLGSQGWVRILAGWLGVHGIPSLIPSFGALLLAHVFYNTTIILKLVSDAWRKFDQRLIDAARSLGANRRQIFFAVILPMLAPALLATATLVFLFDFTSFGVVLVLAGSGNRTLEVEIYYQAVRLLNLPAASLLALLQIFCTLTVLWCSSFFTARAETQSALRPVVAVAKKPTGFGEKFFAACIAAILLVLLVAPLLAPVVRSIISFTPGSQTEITLTPNYFEGLFRNPRESIFYIPPIQAAFNSIWIAGMAACISIVLAIPIAASMRNASEGRRRWLNALYLPLGTSAVTIGLGMLIVFSQPPLQWLSSPFLLPLTHAVIAFPFCLRALLPAFASISDRWREAARSLGANAAQILWKIDIPILLRPILSAAAFAFSISLGEFGAASFLARPDYATLPLAIYRYLQQPGSMNYGMAMASATMLMVLCGGAVACMEHLGESMVLSHAGKEGSHA